MLHRIVWLGIVCLLAALTARAEEQVFVFGQHGVKHSNVVIESNTDLESIVTTSHDVKGELRWDRGAKSGSAKLSVPVVSLSTGIKQRDEHLQGEQWLNAAKHPDILFETTAVKHKDGDVYTVTGNFTMNGVSRAVTAEAALRYLPYKPEFDKAGLPKGNLVKLSTSFELKLSGFNIKTPAVPSKVSDVLSVKLIVMGVNELKQDAAR